jgi:DNA-binding response OmpR family regulator
MTEWNVLLVDDESEFVETLAERLRMRGFTVRAVNDGHEALAVAADDPPHLMIVDLMMPGLGGLEVLQHIKRSLPQVQVILLTGIGSTKEGIEGMRLGAFDYLMKPVNIEDLIIKMNQALAGGDKGRTS